MRIADDIALFAASRILSLLPYSIEETRRLQSIIALASVTKVFALNAFSRLHAEHERGRELMERANLLQGLWTECRSECARLDRLAAAEDDAEEADSDDDSDL